MNAREKLNVAYLQVGLIVAGTLGVLTGSRIVFAVALVVLIVVGLQNGAIRTRRRGC